MSLSGFDEFVLLAVQRQEPEASLEAVRSELAEATSREHSRTTIYDNLKRLERQGWLRTVSYVGKVGRPTMYYAVTAAGRVALTEIRVVRAALCR